MPSGKIRILLKAFDAQLLDQSAQRIVKAAKETGAEVRGPVPMPTRKNIWCVVKPTALGRSSRTMEHFEIRTHKRLLDIVNPGEQTVEALSKLEFPGGVEIELKL
jgi:small subunit ribosomal protein S10